MMRSWLDKNNYACFVSTFWWLLSLWDCVSDVFKGHTAGVRCVIVLNTIEIMSCGDDGTVRRWNTSDGTCTQTCGTQTTAILTVASFPDSSTDFVSCAADHMLQIWQGQMLKQTVALHEPSLPVVCVLSNGDVVTSTWSVAITLQANFPRIEVDS